MGAPHERMLAVGSGWFDPLGGELVLDGRTARLRPRTAALLSHLVRHADRVVGKDELLEAVWPDAVVTEDSLVQCVKEIRQALGPAGRDWIRTVPRQGYAFVAPPPPAGRTQEAREAQPAPLPPGGAVPRPVAAPATRWRPAPSLLAGLLTAGALTLALSGSHERDALPAAAPPRSIVVLPVVNQTGDRAQENPADDLTEALADALARMPRTAVIAPATAFALKGAVIDVRRIGRELNVRYVLAGVLRLDARRPVLTMRLADAATAVQLWSQDFALGPDGMPDLRDDVLGGVASALGAELVRAEARRSGSPAAIRAAELLSRARAVLRWSGGAREATLQARELLEDAVRHDAGVASAWVTLASTYLHEVRFSPTREQDLARAAIAVQRAVALAPGSDSVRLFEGRVQYEQGRMAQALSAFDAALQVNPNNTSALGLRGAALVMLGRPQEALGPIEQAMRLSPRDPQLTSWQLYAGVAHLHLRRDAQAVDWFARAVQASPDLAFGHFFLAGGLGAAGRIDEARAAMAQFLRLRPGFTLGRFRAIDPSDAPAFRAQRERLYEGLRRAGLPE